MLVPKVLDASSAPSVVLRVALDFDDARIPTDLDKWLAEVER
jgi:hypothetical protein